MTIRSKFTATVLVGLLAIVANGMFALSVLRTDPTEPGREPSRRSVVPAMSSEVGRDDASTPCSRIKGAAS